jgi:hypothetical protein
MSESTRRSAGAPISAAVLLVVFLLLSLFLIMYFVQPVDNSFTSLPTLPNP